MKKRAFKFLIYVLVLSAVLISCSAPDAQQSPDNDHARVYYRVTEKSGSLSQIVNFEEVDIPPAEKDRLTYLIDCLFQKPVNPGLESAFPGGTKLISYKLEGGKLSLYIGGAYAGLTDIDRTIADSCAALTLCIYPDVDSVDISAMKENGTISSTVSMKESDVVLSDLSLQPIEHEITLYFPDSRLRYVEPEKHKIIIRENEKLQRYVAEELINGPRSDGFLQLMPEGAKLLSIVTENRTCYINLSGDFLNNFHGTFAEERLLITSIVNTLTSLDGIDAVQILIDGSKRNSFGMIPIDGPLKADQDAVGPVDQQSGVQDVTVYYPLPNSKSVAPVPRKIVSREGANGGQLTLEQLISGVPPFWSYNPVPGGTKIVSFSEGSGTCSVMFTQEFYSEDAERMKTEISAVVATLTEFDNIRAVNISVQGINTAELGKAYRREDIQIQR